MGAVSSSSSKTAITKQQVTQLTRQHSQNMQALQDASAANSKAQQKLIAYRWQSRTDKRITPALLAKLEREATASKSALETARVNLGTSTKQLENISL